MRVHSNATTNPNQRSSIRNSRQSCRALAKRYQVSVATIHRWKHRESVTDLSSRPKSVRFALDLEQERLALSLRSDGLSLDLVVDALERIHNQIQRSSVHRLFVRHGVNRIPKVKDAQPNGTFKEYGPGYLHIDSFYLPLVEGERRYTFVAVDRATRLVLMKTYEHKNKEAATDFLAFCIASIPFKILKVLTDNGREFTNARYRPGLTVHVTHPFGALCRANNIEHRQTKLYTPKTNGLVERTIGLIKADTVKRRRYQSIQDLIADQRIWVSTYNFHRRHRRIGRKTPYDAVCEWHQKQPELFTKEPTHLLQYRSQRGGT